MGSPDNRERAEALPGPRDDGLGGICLRTVLGTLWRASGCGDGGGAWGGMGGRNRPLSHYALQGAMQYLGGIMDLDSNLRPATFLCNLGWVPQPFGTSVSPSV